MLVAILSSITVTALALMLSFPETPAGKWLHRILVEAPARFFLGMTWAKFGKCLLAAAAITLFMLAGPEMLTVLAITGLDAAALLELMLVVWLMSVSGGVMGVWRTAVRLAASAGRLVRTISAPRNRARAPRTRRGGPRPRNDDQAEPGWALA